MESFDCAIPDMHAESFFSARESLLDFLRWEKTSPKIYAAKASEVELAAVFLNTDPLRIRITSFSLMERSSPGDLCSISECCMNTLI